MQVDQPTEDRYANKTEKQRQRLLDTDLKQLGVKGLPMFWQLSYFKCASGPLPL